MILIHVHFIYSIRFRDPKYPEDYMFPAKRLQGAEEPPRVLKPQDFEQMNRGNNDWRPQTGFVPSNKTASVGDAGHRMLGYIFFKAIFFFPIKAE